MAEKFVRQFNKFIESINDAINLKDSNRLIENISKIHEDLWWNYKKINGTSAGFYGIDEYIVFAAFKKFIKSLNNNQEFKDEKINKDLHFFKLEKNNKVLSIYRSSSLRHFPKEAKNQLFKNECNHAPDIAILKEQNNNFKLVAVVEIKNYLDKPAMDSAISTLSQIREAVRDDSTRYVLFSFGSISVKNEKTIESLKKFQENENNFFITNEGSKNKKSELKVRNLSEFFNNIKNEIVL